MVSIIYEDNHLLIVEKPQNIPVQKDESKDEDLQSKLKFYLKQKYNKPGNVFLGLVHRLDRPVGGVMVFAKTSKAASRLSEQLRQNLIKKTYMTIVDGVLDKKEGHLEDFLLKNREKNVVKVVDKNIKGAKKASLFFHKIRSVKNYTLLKVVLETGRSHQIRVQFANLGFPIVGDQKYGKNNNKKVQIALHSYELSFLHPTTKQLLVFTSDFSKNKFPWTMFL
jgi:23S rRNA pseudouridine1911/1915/1917 synthase